MAKIRLDKLISAEELKSRSEVSKIIKSGNVLVNGVMVKNPSEKVDPRLDKITLNGARFLYKEHIYIMMNKPLGVLSASRDNDAETVVDILPDSLKRRGLFPAGRLDKDSEGFILITDDGEFSHKMLSPKNHVKKTYLVVSDIKIPESHIERIEEGIKIANESFAPAEISFKNTVDNGYLYEITLTEGKYHEIKRMLGSAGASVLSLKRIKIGELFLDENLKPGQARELKQSEVKMIINSRI